MSTPRRATTGPFMLFIVSLASGARPLFAQSRRRAAPVALLLAQLVLFASPPSAAQTIAASDSSPIRVVLELQHRIAHALVAGDDAFLDRIYAPEYTFVSASGTVRTKADVLAGRAAHVLRTTALAYDDLIVRVYGPVAVVTGRAAATVEDHGHLFSGQSRFVRVQVFRDNCWQVVHYQVTNVASKMPAPQTASTDGAGDSVAIRQVLGQEDRYVRLQINRDTGAMRRILDDSFIGIDHHGNVLDKAHRLAGYASGHLVFQTLTRGDVHVRVYGTTAVFTARSHATGLDNRAAGSLGKRFDVQHPLTHVWAKTGADWRLVSEHNSDIDSRGAAKRGR